ncbi:hypothetical protein HAX54_005716, partial [Datura stramonium]|nr:hypothetical protein [Datura stramonium]
MAQKVNKGKGIASSSHGSKRARRPSEEEHEDVSMAPPPLRRYDLRWVMEKEGKKWLKEHKESKYSHDMFIDRNCLSLVFPHMVDRILTLGLGFMFNAPGDCNLNMGSMVKQAAKMCPQTQQVTGHDFQQKMSLNSEIGVQNCWTSTDGIAQAKQQKAWREVQTQVPYNLARNVRNTATARGAMRANIGASRRAYVGASRGPRAAVLTRLAPRRGQHIIFLVKPPQVAPKVNKGKGVASSSHGSKRARRPSEEGHEDVSMAPPPLRRYDLRWVMEKEVPGKHVTHVTRERVCIVYALMNGMLINVGVLIKNVLKRESGKEGQNFGFGGLLTQFLWGNNIEDEEAEYRPAYGPRG